MCEDVTKHHFPPCFKLSDSLSVQQKFFYVAGSLTEIQGSWCLTSGMLVELKENYL